MADRDLTGTIVDGKYRLLRLIGRGGMGSVYEAIHEYTERKVAVKLLSSHAANHATMPQRFLREAKASAAIGHPRIVQVLDAGAEESGRLYLVLELLDGESLGVAISNDRVSVPGAMRVGVHVLEALAAAHGHDLVHRDIKPDNIFLVRSPGKEPEAKVLDFGVARWMRPTSEPLTQAGVILGTPDFMSPEHLSGKEVDARVDLWAVGAVLYYALTKKRPFTAKNALGLLMEMTKGARPVAELRTDLPDYLGDFVDRALSIEIEDRYDSAREMANELRKCIGRWEASQQAETTQLERSRRVLEGKREAEKPKWQSALEEIERETQQLEQGKKPRK